MFDVLPRVDRVCQFLEVGASVLFVFEFCPIQPDSLRDPIDRFASVLTGQEDINVDPLSRIDQSRKPACADGSRIAVSADKEEGIILPVHDRIVDVGKIDPSRRNEVDDWDLRSRISTKSK